MSHCQRFGFDDKRIAERLALIGLGHNICERHAGPLQQLVIQPNADCIVDDLVADLGRDPYFLDVVRRQSHPERLKAMLKTYLLSIGRNCCSAEYFERRLHVGIVHKHAKVSLSRYQSAFRQLQSLLIRHIPGEIKKDAAAFESMVQFILKITALDMSLAVETFHSDMLADVEVLLNSDSLTGVRSRQSALQELEQRLEASRANRTSLCAIMADLDHFKSVNDNHGHLWGDEALRVAAKRLVAAAREHDIVGRYGGEEFLIILGNTALDDAVSLAQRMRKKVGADPIHIDDRNLRVTISLGVAEAQDGDNADRLIGRADQMLYKAKLEGRNRVCA